MIKKRSINTHPVRPKFSDLRAEMGTYLDDGRASDDGVVSNLALAASKDDVGLSGEASRDLKGVASADGSGLDEGRAGDSDEGSVELGALGDDLVVLYGRRSTMLANCQHTIMMISSR